MKGKDRFERMRGFGWCAPNTMRAWMRDVRLGTEGGGVMGATSRAWHYGGRLVI